MEYREGSPICWSLQPTGRVPVRQIPGRIVGSTPGYMVIRVFDSEEENWVERSVRPITLRRISPQLAEVLERQEAAWPIAVAPGEPSKHEKCVSVLQEPGSAPARAGDLVMTDAQRLLSEISDLRPSVGRRRNPDTDLHIRTAYRVLVNAETLVEVARLAGITREQVRQRVRLGVAAALDYVSDPMRERIRAAKLPKLRRHVAELKPAIEAAFLALFVISPKRFAAARQAPRRS